MTTHVQIGSKTYKVETTPQGFHVDGVLWPVEAQTLEPGVLSLLLTETTGKVRSFRAIADARDDGDALLISGCRVAYALTDPRSLRAASAGAGTSGPRPLKAPMPGRIVRVLVAEGDAVAQGQGCVVIEAMKMQNELKSPREGIVRKLAATVGETVSSGAVLLIVE